MMSDSILGIFYRDSLRVQRFRTVIKSFLGLPQIRKTDSLKKKPSYDFRLKTPQNGKIGDAKKHCKNTKVQLFSCWLSVVVCFAAAYVSTRNFMALRDFTFFLIG